jgi:protein SCO1/2
MPRQCISVSPFLQRAQRALAIVIVGLILLSCAPTPVTFRGDDLLETPAPNFALSTPDGKAVALTDWRGQVVVLTFVYTQCTDICPLIAHMLSEGYSDLGSDAARVRFVAISTAPETDTPISIAKFSQEQGMLGRWTFLSGSHAQLTPVWKDYFIDVESNAAVDGSISHQSRVIVIDSQGRQRVNYAPDFKSDDLVHDLKALLAQG